MFISWRTKETKDAYTLARANGHLSNGCTLCQISLPKKEFKHWKIQPNMFPYDRVAEVHDLIYTRRHVRGRDLNEEERAELNELKYSYLNDNYQFIIESIPKIKSIPDHYHLHLIVAKKLD